MDVQQKIHPLPWLWVSTKHYFSTNDRWLKMNKISWGRIDAKFYEPEDEFLQVACFCFYTKKQHWIYWCGKWWPKMIRNHSPNTGINNDWLLCKCSSAELIIVQKHRWQDKNNYDFMNCLVGPYRYFQNEISFNSSHECMLHESTPCQKPWWTFYIHAGTCQWCKWHLTKVTENHIFLIFGPNSPTWGNNHQ